MAVEDVLLEQCEEALHGGVVAGGSDSAHRSDQAAAVQSADEVPCPKQYTSIRFAETVALEGVAASIGSIGDAYDIPLAESTIGLFKNEAIREDSPFRAGPLRTSTTSNG